jgi:hypothetical protein
MANPRLPRASVSTLGKSWVTKDSLGTFMSGIEFKHNLAVSSRYTVTVVLFKKYLIM